MGKLSTHVLDTACGLPAAGVSVELFIVTEDGTKLIKSLHTNKDGRTDELLLSNQEMKIGTYEIVFHVGDYFKKVGGEYTEQQFLDSIPIRFSLFNTSQDFHVPLLVSPWSYTTYRGS